MARIDYIDDPEAPAVNSVVPSVVAIVRDDAGRVLMIHKTDNDKWALPGGGHEAGESIADTGIYTNPGHVMAYDDGEVRQQFSIAFRARLLGGEQRTSDENDQVEWLTPEQVDQLDLHPSMRLRLAHALDGADRPHIG
jgi:ADP-ribose pyrophosphatase YjhB (NUDIX family)